MSDSGDQVLVLGAGLAGLSASVELRRAGVPHQVLERDAQPGGLCRTSEEVGYRFDRTGHLLHLRDEGLRREVTEWLGAGALLDVERRSAVFSQGVYTRYPFQANVHGLPPELAYACVRDFVQAHFAAPGAPATTFEDYCLQTFGRAICDAFMIPYNQKLWGVHPRELDRSWCDRFVPRPSLDDVLRGAFGVDPPQLGYNARFVYPRLGAGALVGALVDRAGHVRLSTPALRVRLAARKLLVAGAELPFSRLISSLPLDVLLSCIDELPDAVARAAARLRSVPLSYLDLALNTPVEQPHHWVYVPEERFSFYRVGSYSNLSAAMCPPNKGSLYVELATREPLELATILPRVAAELTEMGMIRAPEAIRFARLRRIEHAYVIFDRAREEALRVIEPFLAERGIYTVGRYGRWTYSSMEDAMLEGRSAGRALAAEFGRP